MKKQAIVVLTAYDFESLQLTLLALDYTVEERVPVVIILNGEKSIAASKVEIVARRWALEQPLLRKVVRPMSSGQEPLLAIQETLRNFSFLEDVEYICKLDDDVIPLKKGWLTKLADCYEERKKAKNNSVGFITGLINNNCWGFGELVKLGGKENEYHEIMNYPSLAGKRKERIVAPGDIDQGLCGTVWQYPYLARWVHHWTSLSPKEYIELTAGIPIKEIPLDIHYSIGCIYSSKDLWLRLNSADSKFDELLIHKICQKELLTKWAVMDEPMIHLFYYTQRIENNDLLDGIGKSLAQHFQDDRFLNIEYSTWEEKVAQQEESLKKREQPPRQFVPVERLQQNYQLLNKWLRIKQKDFNLAKILLDKGYQKIAIYGAGELGKNLYLELKDTPVYVCCFLEQSSPENKVTCFDLNLQLVDINKFFSFTGERKDNIDTIVVTPVYDYLKINIILRSYGINCNIISLEDLVNEIYESVRDQVVVC